MIRRRCGMRGKKTKIKTDLHSVSELRAMAKGDASPRKVKRLLAIANAREGMSFTDAASASGLERQALCDAVKRYNAEGVEGLEDRPRSGRRCKLDGLQEQELAGIVAGGPDGKTGGMSGYTLDDLCLIVKERFGVHYGPTGISAVLDRLGVSRPKAGSSSPKGRRRPRGEAAADASKKRPILAG
jgi:transposase